MKIKIIFVLILLFQMQSCRTEDQPIKSERELYSTFDVFQKSDGNAPNFGKGFAILYDRYWTDKSEFHQKETMKAEDFKILFKYRICLQKLMTDKLLFFTRLLIAKTPWLNYLLVSCRITKHM